MQSCQASLEEVLLPVVLTPAHVAPHWDSGSNGTHSFQQKSWFQDSSTARGI